jgi:hypothetical protein
MGTAPRTTGEVKDENAKNVSSRIQRERVVSAMMPPPKEFAHHRLCEIGGAAPSSVRPSVGLKELLRSEVEGLGFQSRLLAR